MKFFKNLSIIAAILSISAICYKGIERFDKYIAYKSELKEKEVVIKKLKTDNNRLAMIRLYKKELIVYNNTNSKRFFMFQHPETGSGSGQYINPKSSEKFELKGNSFEYNSYKDIDKKTKLENGKFYLPNGGYEMVLLNK